MRALYYGWMGHDQRGFDPRLWCHSGIYFDQCLCWLGGSPNTVTGTYFYQTFARAFTTTSSWTSPAFPEWTTIRYSASRLSMPPRAVTAWLSMAVPITILPATGRYDNVVVGGTSGTPAPALTYDPNATVDGPFTNTFTDDPAWRSDIAAIYVNGSVLTNSAYATNTPGMIIFTPSKSTLLQSSGFKNTLSSLPVMARPRLPSRSPPAWPPSWSSTLNRPLPPPVAAR